MLLTLRREEGIEYAKKEEYIMAITVSGPSQGDGVANTHDTYYRNH